MINIVEHFVPTPLAVKISSNLYSKTDWSSDFGGKSPLDLKVQERPIYNEDFFDMDIMKAIIDTAEETFQQKYEVKEAFWSLYTKGSYLEKHTDHVNERAVSFVWNLTTSWEPEWGGMCNIENRGHWAAIMPNFNSLLLFKVPLVHFVSEVSQRAKRDRISLTGWLKEI